MLLAKIADWVGTLLLEVAAAFLRYAERRYAGGHVMPAHRKLTWDDLPRTQALYEELMRQHGEGFELDSPNYPSEYHPSPRSTFRSDLT